MIKYALISVFFTIVLGLLPAGPLQAQEEEERVVEKRLANLSSTEEVRQKKVFIRAEYFRVANAGQEIAGSAMAAGLYFARHDYFSVGPRFHQSYSAVDGWTTLYTALNFDFTWAITGSLKLITTKKELNGWEYMNFAQYNPGGFRARFSLNQYYYNLPKGAIPLSGFGIEGSYELPSNKDFSVELGVGMDRISSPSATLTPFRAYIQFMDMF